MYWPKRISVLFSGRFVWLSLLVWLCASAGRCQEAGRIPAASPDLPGAGYQDGREWATSDSAGTGERQRKSRRSIGRKGRGSASETDA